VESTDCCIIGSGPGGAMLALLLARKGLSVTLLELHKDFDRNFRGDTLHPSILEILDDIGLADELLRLPHSRIQEIIFISDEGKFQVADFSRLKTRFPYITLLQQARFIEFLVREAARYPNFRLVMGANVRELVEEDGTILGVRYRQGNDWSEVRAPLTVGADGRSSRTGRQAGFKAIETSPAMDVLWFRLPRLPEDTSGLFAYMGRGHFMVFIDCQEYWQVGDVIPKGAFPQIMADGLEAMRRTIGRLAPEFAERAEHLRDWKQVATLSVESKRLKRWYRPGLLLIGDAAHTMSPAGGVGINYAIQDAAAAANLLAGPLLSGHVRLRDLRAVQRRREWPTRIIQMLQSLDQKLIIARALDPKRPVSIPLGIRLLYRLPFVRLLIARLMAFGVWPVHVKN
jgi:2-polyprenyl-6-methoxyphenol hydroxylase-like FAD-dependent oxidoreductase